MALIDAEGVQAVSMARLATELGCGLVALYSLVPSTQALLDGVARAVAPAVVPVAGPAAGRDRAGWSDAVRAQAAAARRAALAHPRCTIAVAAWPPATAASLRPAEQVVATLRAAGFSGPDALAITRVLAAYQVGCLVLEVGGNRGFGSADGEADGGPATADAAAAADFEFGLELLLRGSAALLTARRGRLARGVPDQHAGPDDTRARGDHQRQHQRHQQRAG